MCPVYIRPFLKLDSILFFFFLENSLNCSQMQKFRDKRYYLFCQREEFVNEELLQRMIDVRNAGEVQADAFLGVVCILSRSPENRRLMFNYNYVHHVLEILRKHPLNPKIHERGCWSLLNLALFDKNADEIHKQNAYQDLLDTVKRFQNDENVCENAFWCCKNLTVRPNARKTFSNMGGMEVILTAFENHLTHPRVIEQRKKKKRKPRFVGWCRNVSSHLDFGEKKKQKKSFRCAMESDGLKRKPNEINYAKFHSKIYHNTSIVHKR